MSDTRRMMELFSLTRASIFSRRYLFPVLLLAASVVPLRALCQDTVCTPPFTAAAVADDGFRALRAGWRVLTMPLRWNADDITLAGGLSLGVVGTSFFDDGSLALVDRNRSQGNDRLQAIVVRFGEGLPITLLSVGLYSAGALLGDRWLRETGLLVGTALLCTGVAVQVIKPLAGRSRPYNSLGNAFFRPGSFRDEYHSLPSGHSAAAFSLSAVLAERIGNPWASTGLYTLAAVSALSRIYSRDHWLSDVALSAIIAIPFGRSLVKEFSGGSPEAGRGDIRVFPSGNGITVVWVL